MALGFINQLIEQDLYDHDFVENWTHGFDELKELAAEYTPEKVEEITWVPKEKLLAAVAMAADNTPTTLQSSSAGITHTTNAGHAQRAVFMIPALLGMVDVKGGMCSACLRCLWLAAPPDVAPPPSSVWTRP